MNDYENKIYFVPYQNTLEENDPHFQCHQGFQVCMSDFLKTQTTTEYSRIYFSNLQVNDCERESIPYVVRLCSMRISGGKMSSSESSASPVRDRKSVLHRQVCIDQVLSCIIKNLPIQGRAQLSLSGQFLFYDRFFFGQKSLTTVN